MSARLQRRDDLSDRLAQLNYKTCLALTKELILQSPKIMVPIWAIFPIQEWESLPRQ